MRENIQLDPVARVAAAFALGAIATWVVYRALEHRYRRELVGDEAVLQRVKDRINVVASNPESIDVDVDQGVVRLSGHAPPAERDAVLSSVLAVPGVLRVRNALGVAG